MDHTRLTTGKTNGLHELKRITNIQACHDAYDSFSNESPDFINMQESNSERNLHLLRSISPFSRESTQKTYTLDHVCLTIGKTIST